MKNLKKRKVAITIMTSNGIKVSSYVQMQGPILCLMASSLFSVLFQATIMALLQASGTQNSMPWIAGT